MSIARGRSAPPSSPKRATHGRCVLCHLCRELWRGCAQVCTSVFRVCTVCARVSVSVVHGVHSVQNVVWALTAVFSECFAKCAHICRMCRTLSQNSTRLGNKSTDRRSVRVSGKNSSGQDFSPGSKSGTGAKSGSFFRPGPSGGGFGRIWPNLAPRRLF